MGRPNVNWNVGIAAEKQSTYTSKAVKAGIPFASQVTEPNTKYIIKYDFDLGGEKVTIPEDCILDFEGGTVTNGDVVSNNTILTGIVPKNARLLGSFVSPEGETLTYNQYKLNTFHESHIESFLTNRGSITQMRGYSIGAFGVDDNYIYQLIYKTNSAKIVVFSREFTYIGITAIQSNHCNACFVAKGVLYIGTGSNNLCLYKDTATIVSNAIGGSATTMDSMTLEGCNFYFSYDDKRNQFLTGSSETMYIYDESFNLIDTITSAFPGILDYVKSVYGEDMNILKNGGFVKDGVLVMCSAIHKESSNDYLIPVIVHYDLYNEKVIYFNTEISTTIKYSEGEGCCSIDNGYMVVLRESLLESADGSFADFRYISFTTDNNYQNHQMSEVWVDNTYKGVSTGQKNFPFKRIDEVVTGDNSAVIIHLKDTGNPYYIATQKEIASDLKIVGDSEGKVDLYYACTFTISRLVLENIKLYKYVAGDKEIEINQGSIELNNVESNIIIRLYRSSLTATDSVINKSVYMYDVSSVEASGTTFNISDGGTFVIYNIGYVKASGCTFNVVNVFNMMQQLCYNVTYKEQFLASNTFNITGKLVDSSTSYNVVRETIYNLDGYNTVMAVINAIQTITKDGQIVLNITKDLSSVGIAEGEYYIDTNKRLVCKTQRVAGFAVAANSVRVGDIMYRTDLNKVVYVSAVDYSNNTVTIKYLSEETPT